MLPERVATQDNHDLKFLRITIEELPEGPYRGLIGGDLYASAVLR